MEAAPEGEHIEVRLIIGGKEFFPERTFKEPPTELFNASLGREEHLFIMASKGKNSDDPSFIISRINSNGPGLFSNEFLALPSGEIVSNLHVVALKKPRDGETAHLIEISGVTFTRG